MGGITRNINVVFISSETKGIVSQLFVDWYDFADWLKQCQLKNERITICSWNYADYRH